MTYTDALDRFMAKVAISDKIYGDTPCWEWISVLSNGGYARFWFNRHYEEAHRWAYEYFVGPIPTGLVIDHLCNNPRCVNALHLEPKTQKNNVLRSNGLTALNARKTNCKHGHEFNQQNTWIGPKGNRQCKVCIKLRMRVYSGYKGLPPPGQRTHCPAGHEYNVENTRVMKNGGRQCKTCGKIRAQNLVR